MSDTHAARADSSKAPNSQPPCKLSTIDLDLVRNMVDTHARCTDNGKAPHLPACACDFDNGKLYVTYVSVIRATCSYVRL